MGLLVSASSVLPTIQDMLCERPNWVKTLLSFGVRFLFVFIKMPSGHKIKFLSLSFLVRSISNLTPPSWFFDPFFPFCLVLSLSISLPIGRRALPFDPSVLCVIASVLVPSVPSMSGPCSGLYRIGERVIGKFYSNRLV